MQCLSHTGPAPAYSTCALPAHTAQAPGCSARNRRRPALGCLHLRCLSHSGSGAGYSSEVQTPLGLRFVHLPGLSSSGDEVFGERGWCDLSPPPSLPFGFLGVQLVHLLRRMLTIQNPKKSWLAMKPACSLVDDASLGPWLPPSGSGCPHLPVSGRGWASPQPASSARSFVL